LPVSQDRQVMPSAATVAIPGGPSTPVSSGLDPARQDASAPTIAPAEPGRSSSGEGPDESVVLATLAVMALFIIRAATMASEDCAADSSFTPFQAIRVLDSMTGSWSSKASAT
jgi:hypothetical protein